MIVISGADQYMGYAITSHLARYEHLRPTLRVLCENKSMCLNFAKHDIDVRQVDYKHPNDLSLVFRGVDTLVMAVGNEDERVEYCKHLCRVAAQSGVRSIICISHVGAVSHTHPALRHFAEIEDEVVSLDCQWVILRPDWISQYFHLWAPSVEKYRELQLPLPEQTELCPIDIIDVCKVIEDLLLDSRKNALPGLEDEHCGQVYTLTGPQSVNCKQILTSLIKATGYPKLQYKFTRPMDTSYSLEGLRHDIWFDARLKQERAAIYKDPLTSYAYRNKAFATPTPTQIQTFLDYFDWVHKTSSSICVPHASLITSLPSRPIHRFFQEHANSFKPRV